MDSFCVVGNAPNELGKGLGSKIDDHEMVFRFNNFRIDGYEDDYGSVTTHWVHSFCNDICGYSENVGLKMLCPIPLNNPNQLKRYSATDLNKFLAYKDRTLFIPESDFLELKDLNPNPSTGLSLLWWLHKSKYELTKDNIFGFSFFDTPKNGSHHYFDKSVITTHNGKLEQEIVNDIILK